VFRVVDARPGLSEQRNSLPGGTSRGAERPTPDVQPDNRCRWRRLPPNRA